MAAGISRLLPAHPELSDGCQSARFASLLTPANGFAFKGKFFEIFNLVAGRAPLLWGSFLYIKTVKDRQDRMPSA